MRIGQLAEKAAVSCDTVRLYERLGLIRSERRSNGYRDYRDEMLFIVRYIRTAQKLGFTLDEIGREIPALVSGEIGADRIAEILGAKLAVIDERIAGLTALRGELSARLAEVCPIALPGRGNGR